MSYKVRRLCLVGGWLIGLFGLLLPVVWAANLGDLDPTFGENGIVDDNPPFLNVTEAVALQPDTQGGNKIVVAGEGIFFNGDEAAVFWLSRYNDDGSLDSQFGNGGLVTTTLIESNSGRTELGAMAIQPNGQIVVVGTVHYYGGPPSSDVALARYDANGILDNTFGNGGVMTTSVGTTADIHDIALQSDGKIIIAGRSEGHFALARYDTTGHLDGDFGNGGVMTTSIGTDAYIGRIDLQISPSGSKIVAAGESDEHFAVAHYNTDGTPDSGFGNGGVVTSSNGVSGHAIAFQADRRIVVADNNGSENRIALARYQPDGSLDTTFGNGGIVTKTFDSQPSTAAVAIQAGGKIVMAGAINDADAAIGHFLLVRYDKNGSVDDNFGNNGVVMTTVKPIFMSTSDLALQPDGKIIIAGTPVGDTGDGITLARYIGDLPPTFPTNNPATGSPLITPTQGVSLTTARPPFDWKDATDDVGVTYYTLHLTPNNQALTLQESTEYTTPVSNYTPTDDLANGSYTWTVQAHDLVGHVTSILTPAHFTIAVEEQDDTERVYLPLVLK